MKLRDIQKRKKKKKSICVSARIPISDSRFMKRKNISVTKLLIESIQEQKKLDKNKTKSRRKKLSKRK